MFSDFLLGIGVVLCGLSSIFVLHQCRIFNARLNDLETCARLRCLTKRMIVIKESAELAGRPFTNQEFWSFFSMLIHATTETQDKLHGTE